MVTGDINHPEYECGCRPVLFIMIKQHGQAALPHTQLIQFQLTVVHFPSPYLPARSWIHPSSLGHIHLNVLTTSHKFTSFTVISIFIRLPWWNIHSNVVTSYILTSYSFTISTLIRLIKNCTSVVSGCTGDKYYMLLQLARVISWQIHCTSDNTVDCTF